MVTSLFHILHAAFLKLPVQPGDHRKMRQTRRELSHKGILSFSWGPQRWANPVYVSQGQGCFFPLFSILAAKACSGPWGGWWSNWWWNWEWGMLVGIYFSFLREFLPTPHRAEQGWRRIGIRDSHLTLPKMLPSLSSPCSLSLMFYFGHVFSNLASIRHRGKRKC